MKLRYFQIDAFADDLFHGNPAGVCPLDAWLPAETMQKIAMENNQAETAFFVRGRERYAIRWFTPAVEVDLCGHATLAAGYVLFRYEGIGGDAVEFDSRSGVLSVRRRDDLLTLDFPADEIRANKYDLSISRYKQIEHKEIEYEKPQVIMDKLMALERNIAKDVEEIKGML